MKPIRTLFLFSLAAAALFVALGFIRKGFPLWGLTLIPILGLWTAAHFRRWVSTTALAFTAFTILVMAGLWMEFPPLLLIVGQGLSIAAWDLTRFHIDTAAVQNREDTANFFRSHLAVLAPILTAGIIGSWLALRLELQLGFLPALVLGFILILSLRQMIQRGNGASAGDG